MVIAREPMNRLKINSVKIDNVNSLNLPIKEFDKGLNIICGSNEAGKSTMMSFLKNALFSPASFQGELSLSIDNIDYLVKIQGNKKTHERVVLLAPENKNVNDVLSAINQNFYQKAFTINIADINSLDTELFKLIQDHNASEFVAHKSRLKNELKEFLTDKGKPNKNLDGIRKLIKTIEAEIRELATKEDEYASVISKLQSNEKLLVESQKNIENKLAVQEKAKLENDIKNNNESVSKLKTLFNEDLFANKSKFYELTQKTELIADNIAECKKLVNSDTKSKIEKLFDEIKREFNLELNVDKIDKIDVSRELEQNLRNLSDKQNKSENIVINLRKQKELLENNLEKLSKEVFELDNQIKQLGINDFELFEQGVQELRASISSISEFSENIPVSNNKVKNIILSIMAFVMVVLAFYLHSKLGYIVGLMGLILLGFTIPDFFKKKSDEKLNVYSYVEKDVLPKFDYKGNFLRTMPALNAILVAQENKIKEYERLKRDFDGKNAEINDYKDKLVTLDTDLCKEIDFGKGLEEQIEKLSTLCDVKFPVNIFFDLLNVIKDLKTHISDYGFEQDRLAKLNSEIDDYMQSFADFISKSKLNIGINQAILVEKTREIQQIIEENDKYKHELDILVNQTSELEQRLKNEVVEDFCPEFSLAELQEKFEKLNEEKGTLKEIRRQLESFEGLIERRNKKNVEENKLKDVVKRMFVKKFVHNFITYAEERQREQEPNLISAEKLLATLTDNKYVKADFSNQTITSSDGQTKLSTELSRGTREQLFLAFKLGYAQNYGADADSHRLPLIIDDAFVNFDKTRLTHTLNALKEFAKTNQVLFFTCHKEYITSIIGDDANIIDM